MVRNLDFRSFTGYRFVNLAHMKCSMGCFHILFDVMHGRRS